MSNYSKEDMKIYNTPIARKELEELYSFVKENLVIGERERYILSKAVHHYKEREINGVVWDKHMGYRKLNNLM